MPPIVTRFALIWLIVAGFAATIPLAPVAHAQEATPESGAPTEVPGDDAPVLADPAVTVPETAVPDDPATTPTETAAPASEPAAPTAPSTLTSTPTTTTTTTTATEPTPQPPAGTVAAATDPGNFTVTNGQLFCDPGRVSVYYTYTNTGGETYGYISLIDLANPTRYIKRTDMAWGQRTTPYRDSWSFTMPAGAWPQLAAIVSWNDGSTTIGPIACANAGPTPTPTAPPTIDPDAPFQVSAFTLDCTGSASLSYTSTVASTVSADLRSFPDDLRVATMPATPLSAGTHTLQHTFPIPPSSGPQTFILFWTWKARGYLPVSGQVVQTCGAASPTATPGTPPTPTHTPAPTGHVTVVLDTADGRDIPPGTQVCIDTRCILIEDRAPTATLPFGVFTPGTWPFTIAHAAPYQDLSISFDLPANASTTLSYTLSASPTAGTPTVSPSPTPEGDKSAFIVLNTEDGGPIPHTATVCVGGRCLQITDAYETDFYQFAIHGFAAGQTYPVTVTGIAPYEIGDTFTAMASEVDPALTITMPDEAGSDGATLGFTLVRAATPTATVAPPTVAPPTTAPTGAPTTPTATTGAAVPPPPPPTMPTSAPAAANALPNTGAGPDASGGPGVALPLAVVALASAMAALGVGVSRSTRRR